MLRKPTKNAFALTMAFLLLFGCAGCGNQADSSLETYHNEEYGFSLSIDKELMQYILVLSDLQLDINEDTQDSTVDFLYHEEGTQQALDGSGVEAPLLIEAIFFSVNVVPVGTEPQKDNLQLLGSNDLYSFYFETLETPIEDSMVRERFEHFEEKINQIPTTFTIDNDSQ